MCRKGIGVNIPEPEFGRKAVRQRKRTRRRRPLPWEEFSFLFDDPTTKSTDDPGMASYRDRVERSAEPENVVSGPVRNGRPLKIRGSHT